MGDLFNRAVFFANTGNQNLAFRLLTRTARRWLEGGNEYSSSLTMDPDVETNDSLRKIV